MILMDRVWFGALYAQADVWRSALCRGWVGDDSIIGGNEDSYCSACWTDGRGSSCYCAARNLQSASGIKNDTACSLDYASCTENNIGSADSAACMPNNSACSMYYDGSCAIDDSSADIDHASGRPLRRAGSWNNLSARDDYSCSCSGNNDNAGSGVEGSREDYICSGCDYKTAAGPVNWGWNDVVSAYI